MTSAAPGIYYQERSISNTENVGGCLLDFSAPFMFSSSGGGKVTLVLLRIGLILLVPVRAVSYVTALQPATGR
jgi:hypothetical protein